MNVEYRCPDCGGRLFAPPGGTKLHCPRHTESIYIEVEEYHGPDFLHIDEEGKTQSKDLILAGNARDVPGETSVPEVVVVSPEDMELEAYRTMYESLTNSPVDKRWNVATIQEELKLFMLPTIATAEVETKEEGDGMVPSDIDDTVTEPSTPGEVVEDIPPAEPGDDDDDEASEVNPGPDSPDLVSVPVPNDNPKQTNESEGSN